MPEAQPLWGFPEAYVYVGGQGAMATCGCSRKLGLQGKAVWNA